MTTIQQWRPACKSARPTSILLAKSCRERQVMVVLALAGLFALAAVWPVLPVIGSTTTFKDVAGVSGRDLAGLPAFHRVSSKSPVSATETVSPALQLVTPVAATVTATATTVASATILAATPTITPTLALSPTAAALTAAPALTETTTAMATVTPTSEISSAPVLTSTVAPTSTPIPPEESPDGEPALSAAQPALLLIGEFLYDGLAEPNEGDEFVEICNPDQDWADMTGYKIGDGVIMGGGESMYQFPPGILLPPDGCLLVAKNADQFYDRFAFFPDFELVVGGSGYSDNGFVPNLLEYHAWAGGTWSLSNRADEILLLGPADEILDSVAYGNGDYAALSLAPGATAPEPFSLQRIWSVDTDSMSHDFVRTQPSPGDLTTLPPPPAQAPAPAHLPDGMMAFWGHLHAYSSYSEGAGPPAYALAAARAAGLHFYSVTDPGASLTPGEWTDTLARADNATVPSQFVALPGLEWRYDGGHVTIFNQDVLLNSTDPAYDSLPELYTWLAAHPGAVAQFNHPAGSRFDDFSFDAGAAPSLLLQEIVYDAETLTRYESSLLQSLDRGWQVAPTANGGTLAPDWGRDTPVRTGLAAPALTLNDLLAAIRARRVFATEDSNLAVALRLGGAWMGSTLAGTGSMSVTVDVVDPDPEPLDLFLYDGNLALVTLPFTSSTFQWTTTVNVVPGHYYWLKVVQADGQAAYTAPVWIAGQAPPEVVYLNEMMPAPRDRDWNGDGLADQQDEWIELYNGTDRPIGLGGWQLVDAAGPAYTIPLDVVIPPGGFVTFYRHQTDLSLNNDGDTVTLIQPNGSIADAYSYPDSPGYNGTWCRLPDGASRWSDTCEPSPNAGNWELPPPGPLTVNIYEAKRLTIGAWVRVKGRVTAPPGVLGDRNMYIQDSTAGILIYLPKEHRLYFNLGDKVRVEGELRLYHEEFEIVVEERSDVDFLEPGEPPPPLPIATTSLLEPYEGLLVQLQGQATRFQGRTTFWVDDGTGEARTYIRQSTGIKKPFLPPGTPITAVGVVSQYSDKDNPSRDDYRLLPRYQTDLVLPELPTPPANWPVTLPETGGS